ncbi:MAG: alpha/beta fold hydrolase [Pseudomonadota bacterium]|jgi:Predicted hydrolase of the alpha/beta-hydrolase fold|nr:MAG: alpha/beta hydrolase [Pseudomonadota bacterium]
MRVVTDDSFLPPRWFRNRHVQSILPSLPTRRSAVVSRARPLLDASRELILDCGDGVRLQCFHSSPAHTEGTPGERAAVLLHGWEGSAESLYVLSLAQQLFERGFEVVRLNLRDHGDTHHLNRELFHSCRLPEVVCAVRAIQTLLPRKPLYLIGFSLGGNFMLRVAARAGEAGLDIARVVAVSPVLDPAHTLVALETGFPVYHGYFVRKWLRSLWKKQAAWPDVYDFTDLRRNANLRYMTAELVRRYTEFSCLEEYLDGYSIVGSRLARLEVPASIITALDDPIIPARDLERLARNPAINVTVTRYGGHCGFFENLARPGWAERRVLEELCGPEAQLDDTRIVEAR